MKGIAINRKFVAMLVASAALAAPAVGLATSANAADTQTGITVNAPDGQVLHGTLTAYRLGTYADVENDANGKVKSVNVVGDTTTNKWAENAINAWNGANNDSKGLDITRPNGYDEVGAIAQLNDAGYKTNGTAVSAATANTRLAGVANKLASVAGKPTASATINASGNQTVTLNVPDGLYLLVDSAGNPLIIGTKIGGKDMTKMALGTVTVKEASVVDKKVKTTVDSDYTDNSTESVGRAVDVRVTDAVPNGAHAGGAISYKLTDTPSDMDLVAGSIKVLVGATDVTGQVNVYTTAGQVVKGDATLLDSAGNRTDPDLTVPQNGFIIDATSLVSQTATAGKKLTVTYRAKINGYITTKTANNKITTNTVWKDGSNTHATTGGDTSTIKFYDLTLHKTAQDDTTRKVNGAGFKIKDEHRGTWLKMDFVTGQWGDANNEASATEFFTGDTNHDGKVTSADDTAQQGVIQFKGLSAGTYTIKETTAPTGFRAESYSMPTLKAVISRDGTIKVTGDQLSTLTVDNGNGDFTVKDIDSLLQLPQTGGVWTIGTYLAAATLVGILAAGTASYAGKRRQQAGKPVVAD